VFALPQATLRSPAVMKIKPFGHHSTSKKDLALRAKICVYIEKDISLQGEIYNVVCLIYLFIGMYRPKPFLSGVGPSDGMASFTVAHL
jgi:hypothetical protein